MKEASTEFSINAIREKVLAIVQFGPPTQASGFVPATYYQVTIDPAQISPSGQYIRFGKARGDEIVGWQRCEALTVVEILGKWDDAKTPEDQEFAFGDKGEVTMMISGAAMAQMEASK